MQQELIKSPRMIPGKPIERCRSANLSPPEDSFQRAIICADGRNYSWQVAPLQSLFPLHSGKTNINSKISKSKKLILMKLNVDKYFRRFISTNFKEKKYQKKKEEMEWAIAHNLLIRFLEASASMHIL